MILLTLVEFINKWLGKKADYDGVWDGQCVDLYRFYCKEVLGVSQSVPVGGATEIWDTASAKYFDFILNDPYAVPQKGDILVWDRDVGGGFGHVAIFLEGDVNSFISLDQNWPTISVVTKTKHNYNNIIGWMRSKNIVLVDDYYQGLDLNNKESMKVAVDVWARLRDGKLVETEEYVKIKKENLNLKPKAERWEAICKTYGIKSIEELTRMIDEGQSSTPCEDLLTEKDKECVKKLDDLKKQHVLQVSLLKKQLVTISDVGKIDAILLFFGIIPEKFKVKDSNNASNSSSKS